MGRIRTVLPRHDLDAKANHKPWEDEEPHQYDPTPICPWEPRRSQREVGMLLGLDRGTISLYERRALKKLRVALADLVDNPDVGW